MSGNSADSCSEGESDGEQGKGEVAAPAPTPTVLYVKRGKANGRVPRTKKLKATPSSASHFSPSHSGRRRGSGQLKPVMSENSADSCSEGESDGEQGKGEVAAPAPTPTVLYVKRGKANGRVPRTKKLKATPSSASHFSPSHSGRRRGSGQLKSGKRGVLKRPWSDAERAAVEEHLTSNITELRVPGKADCERCLQLCPLLVTNQRDWRAIKFYCHNRIQLLKKNQRRATK